MFCPSCGSEERQATQFCRACGTDLRAVRMSLERPDSITASAITAREEIGRAFADQIRAVDDARDLERVAEDVLPQIEKFLESPEEKRLRRMRAGVITAAAGLGTFIVGIVLSSIIFGNVGQLLTIGGAGLGLLIFLVGLGLVLNGMRFTLLQKSPNDSPAARGQNTVNAGYAPPQTLSETPALRSPTTSNLGGPPESVTDHTTLNLKINR